MTLDHEIASLFCVGFHGTSPSPEVKELVRRGVHGVILFARNVVDAEQVAALVAELKTYAGRPLLVAVDQEGGRVARLRGPQGFTELPPMRALGERGDAALAREVGALLGRELRAVGIDQDYAPVVDVDTNPANPVIGDRAFSREPEVVGRLGAALAEGLQAQGVAACAKHFPGHGDTSQDSHRDLPRLPHDLEMKAVAEHFPLEEAAPGAVLAGVDALLVCHHAEVQHRAIDLVRTAVEDGRIPRARLAEARARIAGLLRFAGPSPDPARARERLRTEAHLALAARIPAHAAGRDPTAA